MIPRQARSQAWRSRIEVLRRWYKPLDLWLAARIGFWAILLPVLKRLLPLPTLVRLMWISSGSAKGEPAREQRIIELIDWIYRSGRVTRRSRCLERSLLLYRYLSDCNKDPRLVVGMRKDGKEFLGHAWVTLNGQPIHETPAALDDFSTVIIFGPRGVVQSPGA